MDQCCRQARGLTRKLHAIDARVRAAAPWCFLGAPSAWRGHPGVSKNFIYFLFFLIFLIFFVNFFFFSSGAIPGALIMLIPRRRGGLWVSSAPSTRIREQAPHGCEIYGTSGIRKCISHPLSVCTSAGLVPTQPTQPSVMYSSDVNSMSSPLPSATLRPPSHWW